MKLSTFFEQPNVNALIDLALTEDLGPINKDVTSDSVVPAEDLAEAHMVARETCFVSGIHVAVEVFRKVNPDLVCEIHIEDGCVAEKGTVVLVIKGSAQSILTGERTALNFMQRMSGIATLTNEFVKAVDNPNVKVLDTRKTTPGHRAFEKYAVLCGGGTNHRIGLYDAVMIKDNHLAAWQKKHGTGVGAAVDAARANYPGLKIEVEVDTVKQLKEALSTNPDWILLDNMPPTVLTECVELCRSICKTEASGGITLDTIHAVAQTGVDAISVGALTHSASSIDLALDFIA